MKFSEMVELACAGVELVHTNFLSNFVIKDFDSRSRQAPRTGCLVAVQVGFHVQPKRGGTLTYLQRRKRMDMYLRILGFYRTQDLKVGI